MNFGSIWRKQIRDLVYKIMGSKCAICGYDKCVQALDFHHIDPNEKEFAISVISTKTITWEKVENELRKCVVLCSNCHRELHAGIINPILKTSFNDKVFNELSNSCEECGKPMTYKLRRFCSKSCEGKANGRKAKLRSKSKLERMKIVCESVNLLSRHNGNMWQAATEIGMSDNGLRKRFKKATGCTSWQEHLDSLPKRVNIASIV